MDTNFQIQGIKLQLDYMKMRIDNIIIQNKIPLMMKNVEDNLFYLSIQMLNTGLQAFINGINLSMNKDKFYKKLSKISEQINNILSSHHMINQNMIFQQQKVQLQIIQQQMKEQQRIMGDQKAIMQNMPKINVIFEDLIYSEKKIIIVQPVITFKELFEKYKNEIGIERYNTIKCFVTNSYTLLKGDNNRLEKYYPNIYNMDRINITVFS